MQKLDDATIQKKFWKRGEYEYGYILGKTTTLYFVQYAIPSHFRNGVSKEIKLYKSLKSAKKQVEIFEEKYPEK